MGSVHLMFHVVIRIIPPLIPILAVELGFPLWKLGLLVSVYFVGSSIGLLPAGVLSDAYDRRITLTLGILLASMGYLVFGLAPSIGAFVPTVRVLTYTVTGPYLTMVTAMFVAGIGTSVHVPVGVPIISANVNEGNKGKLFGIWGGSSKIGDAVTPAVIGVLILVLGWAEIVLVFAATGLLYAVVLFLVLSHPQFDTIPRGTAQSDTGATTRSFNMFADRRVYLYPILVLILYFAGYQIVVQGVVAFTPVFIVDVYQYSFTFAGVQFAPESFADFALSTLLVAGAISRVGAGALVDRFQHTTVLFVTLVVATLALFALTVLPLGPLSLLILLAIFGGALWGNSPARDTLISDLSPAEREGRTFSYLWTASRIFGAISPVLIGYIADTAGIQNGFWYLTIALATSAIAVILLFSDRVYVPTDHSGTVPR